MDWISLQKSFARDPDLSSRTSRMLALEAILSGTLYDALPFPFSCEKTGAGEYVPLSERRPSVRTGLCRVVVDDSVSLLFSEGHFPAVQSADSETAALLSVLVKETRLNETMLEAATRGSIGSVAILLRVASGLVHFDVMSAAYLWPEWAVDDPRRLIRVTERYKVHGRELSAQGYDVIDGQTYWFKRAWDEESETWYLPEPVGGEPTPSIVDPDRSVQHSLGFVPVVWIKNLSAGMTGGPDGACTFAPAIDTVIEADYLLSQAGRGLKYGSDPTLVLKDGGGYTSQPPQRTGGAATALLLPPEGDAKLLEINGNAASAVLAHVKELRAIALEAMHGNRSYGDRLGSPQSGRAIELMCQGLIWLADRLRISYGEGALLSIFRMVCLASRRVQGGIEINGQRYANIEPAGLGLRWPAWFSANFTDRQAQASTLETLTRAGILSRETATALVAGAYDVEDVTTELGRITAETKESAR